MLNFKNLEQLKRTLDTQEKCLEYYESVRFEEGYFCPHCGGEKHYKLKKQFQYRCANKECRKSFNVLTGTIFENTKIALTSWFTAIFICTTNKKGISSIALSQYLGVRQATAWFILHRIREMLQTPVTEMAGPVQVDEAYYGGKIENKHEKKIKELKTTGRGIMQTPIISVVSKDKVKTVVTSDTTSNSIYKVITDNVKRGEKLITDGYPSYKWVGLQYEHVPVKHNKSRVTYGENHTNNVESFFSHLKRMIYGTYHQVSPKHLQRYCDEMDFRFSTRKLTSDARFDEALRQSEKRLTYTELTKNAN